MNNVICGAQHRWSVPNATTCAVSGPLLAGATSALRPEPADPLRMDLSIDTRRDGLSIEPLLEAPWRSLHARRMPLSDLWQVFD